MPKHKTPAPCGEPAPVDFRQEIALIIQEVSTERWVIEEARAILEARAMKIAWAESLGIQTRDTSPPA
ncbi:MAG: hypothetical protein M3360_05980 [Actinomycetota bacterium]|nr:hypothetical protein [Actinomycetota bacterium]